MIEYAAYGTKAADYQEHVVQMKSQGEGTSLMGAIQ